MQPAPEIVFPLFGFHCDFDMFQTLKRLLACHHQAVVGFVGASFEGGRKSGGEWGRLLNCGSALK